MINMLRKGIKFSLQRVYFPQIYFESRHYGKRFTSIGKFKSLTFQLRTSSKVWVFRPRFLYFLLFDDVMA